MIELAVTLVALGALASSIVSLLREREGRVAVELGAAAAILLLVFAARWALTTPTFVHANLHGPLLLNAPYYHPATAIRNYGPFGIMVQGLVMRLIRADLTVVAAMNQIFAVLTVGLMGWVAMRWTRSRVAGLCVIAAAALNPVLMRQGSSEDAHNLAVLLAWLAIVAMDRYAETGERAALTTGTAAGILMIETRQIMFAFVPIFPVLGLLRARFSALQQRQFWVATGTMAAVLVVRIVASEQDADQAGHIGSIMQRLGNLDAIKLAVTKHPMLDVPRFAIHLLPLYLVGATWLIRHSWAGRFLVVAVLGLFASSLWLYEGQNVAFMFRMPVLTVGLFVAGLGAWSCSEFLLRRLSGPRAASRELRAAVYIAVIGGLCLAPVAQPGWAILDEVRPLTREYEYIKSMRSLLPREVILVSAADVRPGVPAYQFPTHLLDAAGIVVRDSGNQAPRIFLRGVYCRAYALPELLGVRSGYDVLRLPPAVLKRVFVLLGGTTAQGFEVPAAERPECSRLLDGATPIGEPLRINAFPQDPPFVMFGVDSIELQFYQLPVRERGATETPAEPVHS